MSIKELLVMIKIDPKKTTAYVTHKITENSVSVCKISKKCSSEEEAEENLIRLLSGNVAEKQLFKRR